MYVSINKYMFTHSNKLVSEHILNKDLGLPTQTKYNKCINEIIQMLNSPFLLLQTRGLYTYNSKQLQHVCHILAKISISLNDHFHHQAHQKEQKCKIFLQIEF